MKKKFYSLLSISYLAMGLFIPNFAFAELSDDLGKRYENGATHDGISCPNGMCDDYSNSPQDVSWPVSHKASEDIVYIEEAEEEIEKEEIKKETSKSTETKETPQEETEETEEVEVIEEVEKETEKVEEVVIKKVLREPTPKKFVNKYYMRFDLGMAVKDPKAKFQPTECGNGTTLACINDEKGTFIEGSYGGALSKSIGLGANLGSFLRFDATLSQRADFKFDEDLTKRGTTAHFDKNTDPTNNIDKLYDKSMEVDNNIQNLTAMASLYIDFFRRYSINSRGRVSKSAISPYIGVGVGYSRNTIEDMTGDFVAHYEHTSGTAYNLDGLWRLQGASSSALAWKFTGGLNFAISDRTWLDISYNYLNLGKVKTSGRYTITVDTDINENGYSGDIGDADIDGKTDASGNPADPGYLEYDNAGSQEFELELHEVMIGLRYEF